MYTKQLHTEPASQLKLWKILVSSHKCSYFSGYLLINNPKLPYMSLTNVNPAMHRNLVKEAIVCFENLKICVSLPWSLIMIWRTIDLITSDWMGLSCACFQICISVYQLYVIVDFVVLFSYIHTYNKLSSYLHYITYTTFTLLCPPSSHSDLLILT